MATHILWMLTWFDKQVDSLGGELELTVQHEGQIRDALGFPPEAPIYGAEFPISPNRQLEVEAMYDAKLDFSRFDYFIGAVAAER